MAGWMTMKTMDMSQQADARRFRFWTAMIQNQPNAIKNQIADYSNPDEIREKLDMCMATMTLCNNVLKAINPIE